MFVWPFVCLLWGMSVWVFGPFPNYIVVSVFYIFRRVNPCRFMVCRHFWSFSRLPFHPRENVLRCMESVHLFLEGHCIYVLLLLLYAVPLVGHLRHHHQIQGHGDVQLFFLLLFYSLAANIRTWFILHYRQGTLSGQVHPQDSAREVRVLQCHLLDLFFVQWPVLARLSEIKWKQKWGFISGFSSLFSGLNTYSNAVTHIWNSVLVLQHLLEFHMNMRMFLSISQKKYGNSEIEYEWNESVYWAN